MNDILDTITRTASERFGIHALKPYQILVIQRIMEQEESGVVRNQIVVLPTGTGKSLCFLIPAFLCKGITVIVYPILALMNDQISKLDSAGIESICIRGGQSPEERDRLFRRLEYGTKIVVTTPESLQRWKVLNRLRRHRISLLVVDEAHVISQWGESFRPAYLALSEVVSRLRPQQVIAFTATASEKTVKDIRRCLFKKKPLLVRGDADRPNLTYRSYPTLNREQALVAIVGSCIRPALVFCRTRSETRTVCMALRMDLPHIPVRYYNAGLSRKEREGLEKWFMHSRDGVLVATSAYGLGVDKADVRTVIHHSLPDDIEEYLQESGRAGRDGEDSTAWVLVSRTESSPLSSIFTGSGCRRSALLAALGQEKVECTGCDVCLKQVIGDMDGRREIIRLVRTWPFRFNPMTAAFLLCGSRNVCVSPLKAVFNPFYSCKSNWNPRRLEETIEELSERSPDFPISCVKFLRHGKLLYPSDVLLYNLIASLLRRINDGHCWIVRKAGRPHKNGKKVR